MSQSPNLITLSVRDFLAATAAKQPTPGGGSVAALAGALAASLAAMALEYTVGKKAALAHDAELRTALARLQHASALFQELIAEDIAAYAALSPLLKLSPEERSKNTDYLPTVLAAIRAPESVGGLAMNVLELCSALESKTSKFLITDLAIAATYAHATVHAAEFNTLINLPLLPDPAESATLKQAASTLSAKADNVYAALRARILATL